MSIIISGMFGLKLPCDNKKALWNLQSITGVKWDAITKTWWIPVDRIYDVAFVLHPYYPQLAERLKTSPRFAEVRDIVQKKKEAIKKSFVVKANIDIPKPEGLDYKNYQYGGISYAYDLWKAGKHGVFIADDMGLGKTVEALGFINKIRDDSKKLMKTLIVCPASLKRNWYREAEKWLIKKTSTIIIESGMPDAVVDKHNIVIINYDILNRYLKALVHVEWDVVIYDESQYMKNDRAVRSLAARSVSRVANFVVLLTGTPIMNRPLELWHQLHVIDPDQFASKTQWMYKFCAGGYTMGSGASNLDKLQDLLRSTYMVRRMKDDVLTELPPKIRQVVEISKKGFEKVLEAEAPFKQRYTEIENKLSELEAKAAVSAESEEKYRQELSKMQSGRLGTMGEIARIRHETARAKVGKVVDFIKDVLDTREKVVVFAHHRDVIEQIAEAFKGHSAILYGGMDTRDKDNAVQSFRTNPNVRVIVLSIAAGGVGLTLVEADTVVFAELSFVPSEISQAEDRCNRIGQKNTVFIYHLVVEDSIDAYIAKKCVDKQDIIDAAVNGGGNAE